MMGFLISHHFFDIPQPLPDQACPLRQVLVNTGLGERCWEIGLGFFITRSSVLVSGRSFRLRLGEMMAAPPKAPGGRPYQSTGFSKTPVTDKLATLIDAGIDKNLEADATEIRLRAERRLGEMMDEGKDDRAAHGGDRRSKDSEKPLKPNLAEAAGHQPVHTSRASGYQKPRSSTEPC